MDILSQQISAFNSSIAALRKQAERIGTERDTASFRTQLQHKREECGATARDLIQNLKKAKVDRSEKARYDKLMMQYSDILKSFKDISADSIQREKMIPARPEPRQVMPEITQQPMDNYNSYQNGGQQNNNNRRFGNNNQSNNTYNAGATQFSNTGWEEEEQRRREEQERQRGQFKMETETRNVEQRILQERNEEIKKLEGELQGLNDMFVDVSNLVVQQGTMITSIEDNTRKTADETKTAVQELQKV